MPSRTAFHGDESYISLEKGNERRSMKYKVKSLLSNRFGRSDKSSNSENFSTLRHVGAKIKSSSVTLTTSLFETLKLKTKSTTEGDLCNNDSMTHSVDKTSSFQKSDTQLCEQNLSQCIEKDIPVEQKNLKHNSTYEWVEKELEECNFNPYQEELDSLYYKLENPENDEHYQKIKKLYYDEGRKNFIKKKQVLTKLSEAPRAREVTSSTCSEASLSEINKMQSTEIKN